MSRIPSNKPETVVRAGSLPEKGRNRLFASIGEPMVDSVRTVREIYQLFKTTVRATLQGRFRWRAVMEQMQIVGTQSLVFTTGAIGFLSMILVVQSGTQIERILPDFGLLGPTIIELLVKQFGPTVTALMIATKVGTGIAAEIGSMVVTEQVDALKMSNTDPIEHLVVPRFIACTVMLLVLTIVAVSFGILVSLLTAKVEFGVNPISFWDLQFVQTHDIVMAICKCISMGLVIPIIAAQAGLKARGGSEGVGWATTRAVVNASLAVIVLDFFWSAFFEIIK
jgi:phospholipid/cholesterol/gamma-HCH transport system permease protein